MGRQSRPKSKPMGAKLKLIRQHFGLSQTRMLAIVRPGFDPENRAVISQYEKGITDPDYPTLLNYARYARVSTDVLIDDERELTPEMLRRPVAKDKRVPFSEESRSKLSSKPVGESEATFAAGDEAADDETIDAPAVAAVAAAAAALQIAPSDVEGNDSGNVNAVPPAASLTASEPLSDAVTGIESESGEVKNSAIANKPITDKTVTDAAATGMPDDERKTKDERATDGAGKSGEFRRPPRRCSSAGASFDCAAASGASTAIEVADALLAALDDLYLELLTDVPYRTRLLLERRHFYHALLAAARRDYQRVPERSSLLPVWKLLVSQVEFEAGQPPQSG